MQHSANSASVRLFDVSALLWAGKTDVPQRGDTRRARHPVSRPQASADARCLFCRAFQQFRLGRAQVGEDRIFRRLNLRGATSQSVLPPQRRNRQMRACRTPSRSQSRPEKHLIRVKPEQKRWMLALAALGPRAPRTERIKFGRFVQFGRRPQASYLHNLAHNSPSHYSQIIIACRCTTVTIAEVRPPFHENPSRRNDLSPR